MNMADVFELNREPSDGRTGLRRKRKTTDSERLKADMATANEKLDEALALLRPHVEPLANKERLKMPKPHDAFAGAARRLVQAVQNYPELAIAARFDATTVVTLLDEADSTGSLSPRVDELTRLLADSRLLRLAQAFDSSRVVYVMAKAGARSDGALRTVVDALAPAFATRRKAKKAVVA
jgi:hypothetical protein